MTGISDLPIETLAQIVFETQKEDEHPVLHYEIEHGHGGDDFPAATTPVKALSETTHGLRVLALPHLWRDISIFIDCGRFADAIRCLKGLSRSGHPAREHARTLQLYIDNQRVASTRKLLGYLDVRLANVIEGLSRLERVNIVLKSSYEWPRAMQAIYKRHNLLDLTMSARGNSRAPDVRAAALRNLTLDSDVGSCRFDLAAFPALQQLNLSMDDNSSFQSWDSLQFPSAIWETLKALSLRGFALDPIALLARLASSLASVRLAKGSIALQDLSYHIARDEQDATYALEVFQNLPLQSFGFTVPVLFDARYARKIPHTFPKLKKLELYAFTKAAAWQWPDAFNLYANVLSDLKDLEELSINHNELPELSLPLSLPTPGLPGLHLLVDDEGAIPPVPSQPGVAAGSSTLNDEASAIDSTASANEDAIQHGPSTPSSPESEQTNHGPLGANFCLSASPEQSEKRQRLVDHLGEKMPRLSRVFFEPCDAEPFNVDRCRQTKSRGMASAGRRC